jgi:UDP-2,3-diacylglucosamine pyrophosphatase LpxH
MSKQSYRLKGNQKVYIIPIGDLHICSPEYNAEYLEYCLDKIDEIKSQKRIYLMGDLLECASLRVGNSSFKAEMSLDEQLDHSINLLKPYKRDIINAAIGNHEIRLSKDYDFNIMSVIGRALKTSNGNQFIDVFTINGEPIRVYTAHGKGSSAHHYTAMSKIIRDTQHIAADILLQGHNHRSMAFSLPLKSSTGIERKHYGFTGAFLSYGGYADAMQLPPLPESFIQLSINKDLRVRGQDFNIDECKPDLMRL